jgi:hypothetical protein
MSYLPGMAPPPEPAAPGLDDLAAAFESALFFDIETAGLASDSPVTMIAPWPASGCASLSAARTWTASCPAWNSPAWP